MRKISFGTNVQARPETVWELMLDRIEHPPLPGISEVRIVERRDDFLIREVRARWMLIRERVTIDPARREIRFAMEEHPLFFGSAVLRAVPLARQSPVAPVYLSLTVNWAPKDAEAERTILETMPSEIQQEVLSLKDAAEARDRA
jgi:hypothetical protein